MRILTLALVLIAGLLPEAKAMRAAQIASGLDTSCAIVDNGEVHCWGGNRFSILGAGVNDDHLPFPAPVIMGFPHGHHRLRDMRQVSVSPGDPSTVAEHEGGHACAVSNQAEVWCWGRATGGRLGTGTDADEQAFAERVHFDNGTVMKDVLQVAAGGAHTCALRDTGRVHCWGHDRIGPDVHNLLGEDQDILSQRERPARTGVVRQHSGELTGVVEIGLGRRHGCARTDNGRVWCWGYNGQGQLGSGSANNASDSYAREVRIRAGQFLENTTALTVGNDHSCAITADRHVYCWGDNQRGQSGYRDTGGHTPQYSPYARVVFGPGGGNILGEVRAVTAGSHHTCVRDGAGGWLPSNVRCWGDNSHGQIGSAVAVGGWSVRPALVTQALPGTGEATAITEIEQLSAGHRFSCILHRQRRDVRCWGQNQRGQRGLDYLDGPDVAAPMPRPYQVVLGIGGIPVDSIFADRFDNPL